MPRTLKLLPSALAFVGLSLLVGCTSSGSTKARLVNAIPDNGAGGGTPVDVYFNGTNSDQNYFTDVAFDTANPTPQTPAVYKSVPSGSNNIQAYDTTDTTGPILEQTTANFSGSTDYTILLAGFVGNSPQAYIYQDNNSTPSSGNASIRVLNGSASQGATGIRFNLYANGSQPGSSFITVALGGSSGYQKVTYQPNGYSIEVETANGAFLFNYAGPFANSGSSTAGPVVTLVIVDEPGGGAISPQPYIMTDLN